jgi:hypothetical protein
VDLTKVSDPDIIEEVQVGDTGIGDVNPVGMENVTARWGAAIVDLTKVTDLVVIEEVPAGVTGIGEDALTGMENDT